ncbi:MAG: DNA polymerase Y family protein [Acidobacteriota bacterium]
MRIACFFVPLFPLAARLRSEPELTAEAVIITEGNGSAARVFAATRRARKEGIRSGLTLAQARALLPKLIARARDAECERTAQEALVEIAESFSPRVEDAGSGMVYLDISGLERHFKAVRSRMSATAEESSKDKGHAAWEHSLAQSAIHAVERIGLPVRVGIAASKLAARIAAELPKSPTIVPAGSESSFLAPLPLARLTPELEAAEMLQRWGLSSIGELAQLPEREVAARLGESGRDLHWAARGIDPQPLQPRQPLPEFREGMDLEWPLVSLEPFVFVANAALDRLTKRMELQGFACTRLELTLRLEPDGFHSRAIDLPAPTRDVKTLLTLTKLDLEANPPGAPVAGFLFVAHPDRPRRAQLSLFGPAALSPDKVATTIARIASMVGADRVGTPGVVNGHAPERFTIDGYDPPPPPPVRRQPRQGRGLLAVRVLRPVVPLEVISTPAVALASIRSLDPGQKALDIHGHVRVASGPWDLEEAWWSDTPTEREYWDVELSTGGVYRVFRECANGEWFVDGIYD